MMLPKKKEKDSKKSKLFKWLVKAEKYNTYKANILKEVKDS